MFKLQRQNKQPSSTKSGEKIDFKFSNFQALQVPKGWDKLYVSVLSAETGKTIAKLSKALVRNGNCQWPETLSHSIWMPQDDSSKELEECLFKFILAMGSSRSGILGEATTDMAQFTTSKASIPISLPLRKCNYGTILQVKIQCVTPRAKLRLDMSKDTSSHVKYESGDSHDTASQSNGSGNSFASKLGSPTSQDLGSASQPGKFESRDSSYPASGSNCSFELPEGSIVRDISQEKDLSGGRGGLGERQDTASFENGLSPGKHHADAPSLSNHSSFNSRTMGSGYNLKNHPEDSERNTSAVTGASVLTNAGASKSALEAAEDTIEELRAEAKTWERNSRKLMLDLDILKTEHAYQSKKHAELELELSTAHAECDGLKKEVQQLKLMLEETVMKHPSMTHSSFQSEGAFYIRKELEDEIKFQQESNADLALQLKRSQESNIELVAVLQEMEETIENQKAEIENLSSVELKLSDMETFIQKNLEENKNLLLQLQQMTESEKSLRDDIRLLEQALEEKNVELENVRNLNRQSVFNIEEFELKLAAKEQMLAGLEATKSVSLQEHNSEEIDSTEKTELDLMREIEVLNEKVQELEQDCDELTEENLELLIKLKEFTKNSRESANFEAFSSGELLANSCASTESDVIQVESHVYHLEEEQAKKDIKEHQLAASETSELFHEIIEQLKMAIESVMRPWNKIYPDVNDECKVHIDDLKVIDISNGTTLKGWAEYIFNNSVKLNKLLGERITEFEVLKHDEVDIKDRNGSAAEADKELEDHVLKVQDLHSTNIKQQADLTDLEREMAEKISEIQNLEAKLSTKEEENNSLRQFQKSLEAEVSDLQKEKDQLQQSMEIMLQESNITAKCLDALRNDLMVLTNSVNSHVSANKILERKSSELEYANHELEINWLKLKGENIQLSEHQSELEAQLSCMSDERASSQLQLDNSNSFSMSLQDEVGRLKNEMDAQKAEFSQQLDDMQTRWSEVKGECKHLQLENQELKTSCDILIEECSALQKSIGELTAQKLELHKQCSNLEAKLKESKLNLSACSRRVEALEDHISSMLENFSNEEQSIMSELVELTEENRKQKEKLALEEVLFNKMYMEKTAEIENLQREMEHLSKQTAAVQDEREKIASEATHEVTSLSADKANLESALEEVQSKFRLSETELNTLRLDTEVKVQSLILELASSKQNHKTLIADHEKMLKLLASYRSDAEKFKTAVNDLELKLTVAEYERKQLIEEAANLKVQLEKVVNVQEKLQSELKESKVEKEKLEASLRSMAEETEELKSEKSSSHEKISSMQKELSEYEEYKLKCIALEEKVLKMDSDLKAKEGLCKLDAEKKNEFQQLKTENKQYRLKVKQLQDQNTECTRKAQVLEEELKLMEKKQDKGDSGTRKNKIVKTVNQKLDNKRRTYARSNPAREVQADQKNPLGSQSQRDGDSEHGSPQLGANHIARIQSLENELAEALEANNKYKTQLERMLSEGRNRSAATPRKSMAEGEVVAKEKYERTKSSLESELRDLRERYLKMSLQYAEVEAQRENLVMQLKATKTGRRWFS